MTCKSYQRTSEPRSLFAKPREGALGARLWGLAALLALATLACYGQTPTAATSHPADRAAPTTDERAADSLAKRDLRPPPADPMLPAGRTAATDDLAAAIARLSAKLDTKDYTTAWIGLLSSLGGVAVGALVTLLTQRRMLAHQNELADKAASNAIEISERRVAQDRELAAARARLEIGNSFVQWQLKQLSQLYGPLHALFQQSQSLYRHMNSVLEARSPGQFRLRDDPTSDRIDKRLFEICLEDRWRRFRTVLHIDKVYGHAFGVEDYFDGIAAIGARIVKVIEENAGYARPEQRDLVSLFGRYLAHQAVLERLIKHHKSRLDNPSLVLAPMSVDESAVFPAEIQTVIDTGYHSITEELNAWRARAGA